MYKEHSYDQNLTRTDKTVLSFVEKVQPAPVVNIGLSRKGRSLGAIEHPTSNVDNKQGGRDDGTG